MTPSSNPDDGRLNSTLGQIIGGHVRTYRLQASLTTGSLAELADLSKAMVSKIENAKTSPSLATLERLAHALQIPLTAFFRGLDEEYEALLIPAGGGPKTIAEHGRLKHEYEFLGSNRGEYRRMEPMLVTLKTQAEVFPLFQHPGTEWIYMVAGEMEYGSGNSRYRLKHGDSLQFHGHVTHGPTKLLRLPVRFLSIKAYGALPLDR